MALPVVQETSSKRQLFGHLNPDDLSDKGFRSLPWHRSSNADWARLTGQRDEMRQVTEHSLVDSQVPLSDEGRQSIQTEVQQLIEAFRERCLLDEYKGYPYWTVPHFIDISLLHEVGAAVGASNDAGVGYDDNLRLHNVFPASARTWLSTDVLAQLRAQTAEPQTDLFGLVIPAFSRSSPASATNSRY
ncbi:hypothetical protein OE88DRAFT_1803370 [Heliocybe sulcata]|uniref:Uncharacterized protein n=1 Tax=Heliocybe sulcata TaxID=5364 RepID=A0A5C3NSJ3_9AGAM|nr:hypothetical protein OE88DRAFT_1803370 [Heliocybe sulcata]